MSEAFPRRNNSWGSSFTLAVEWPLKYSAPFSGALEPFLNLPSLILPWHHALLTAHSGHPRDHPGRPSPKFLSLGTLCPQTLSRGFLPTVLFLPEQSEATGSQASALRELGEGRGARGPWPGATSPTYPFRVTWNGDGSLCSRYFRLEVQVRFLALEAM